MTEKTRRIQRELDAARDTRGIASAALTDIKGRSNNARDMVEHVDEVLEGLGASDQDQVLSGMELLREGVHRLGPAGAAELITRLSHFLVLDGAVLEGKEPWPTAKPERKRRR